MLINYKAPPVERSGEGRVSNEHRFRGALEQTIKRVDLCLQDVLARLNALEASPDSYTAGSRVAKGTTAFDRGWTMRAIRTTTEDAAPLPTEAPSYDQPAAPSFSQGTAAGSPFSSGQTYTFTDDGWIEDLQVWVDDAADDHRVLMTNVTTGVVTVTYIAPAAGAWVSVPMPRGLVRAGNVLRIVLETTAGSPTYAYDDSWWPGNQPSWATVAGYDSESTLGAADRAYGIRLHFQPATVSNDWAFVARST